VGRVGIRPLFSAAQIAERVDALAGEIARTIPGDFVIVGLLKGAAVFVADLVRALDRAGALPQIEFMRLSSYGLGMESSGRPLLRGDVPTDLAGRRVLLVDDIVDTGRTLAQAGIAAAPPPDRWPLDLCPDRQAGSARGRDHDRFRRLSRR
jgi:hypoxanthine phosphoribosyltransferase